MKKTVCMLVALLICLSSVVALAEATPSKVVTDLTKVTVVSTTKKTSAGPSFLISTSEDEIPFTEEHIEACEVEKAKLAECEDVEEYFGEDLDLKSIVGSDNLVVHEMTHIGAINYDVSYGDVTVILSFATPYEEGEIVAVLIGIITKNPDGTQTTEWRAFEGVGVDAGNGETGIMVEFDPETVNDIQNNMALVAIVSAEDEAEDEEE